MHSGCSGSVIVRSYGELRVRDFSTPPGANAHVTEQEASLPGEPLGEDELENSPPHHRIYPGMAPGVGKTAAASHELHRLQASGVDVVVVARIVIGHARGGQLQELLGNSVARNLMRLTIMSLRARLIPASYSSSAVSSRPGVVLPMTRRSSASIGKGLGRYANGWNSSNRL